MSPVSQPLLMRLVLLAQVPGLLAVAALLAFDDRGERLRAEAQTKMPVPAMAAAGLVLVAPLAEPARLGATLPPPTPLHLAPAASLAGTLKQIPVRGEASIAPHVRRPAASRWSPTGLRHRTTGARWGRLAYASLPFLVLLPLVLWFAHRLSRRLQLPQPQAGQPQAEMRRALLEDAEARQVEMAQELHDGVGSTLAGVSMLLGTARSFTHEPEAAALIATSQDQVAKITQQIRQISRGIMPAGQERGGLVPALEHFAMEMSAIRGVRCAVRSRGSFDQVPAREGGHLFRVVQEATNNALRHGRARRIRITLAQVDDWRRLTIADDGQGCDLAAALCHCAGFGIRSMQARAQEIGAAFRMDARSGRGTRVQIAWRCAFAGDAMQERETWIGVRRVDGRQRWRHPAA